MKVWNLKKKNEKRFRQGHPWVFSNELTSSPKGIGAGEGIELRSESGEFLARGYGNPASLIAFRELTRTPQEQNPLSHDSIYNKLIKASFIRHASGFENISHRLIFGEADQIPGLIVDRFFLDTHPRSQCFVLQAQTAGADLLLENISESLNTFVRHEAEKDPETISWNHTAIVINNDTNSRKIEGLEPKPAKIEKEIEGVDLSLVKIKVFSLTETPFSLHADLIGGQKTGFFLDQSANIQLTQSFLKSFLKEYKKGSLIRVLDICCYVGQWGAHLAHYLISEGYKVEVVGVDVSQTALTIAQKNVTQTSAQFKALKMDVMNSFHEQVGAFDIVICDPPAFIKNRKHYPEGLHAYMKLNEEALKACVNRGLFVTCSCSGLLLEEDFMSAISKASLRSKKKISFIARARQAADHPIIPHFPEGKYLKGWIGFVF